MEILLKDEYNYQQTFQKLLGSHHQCTVTCINKIVKNKIKCHKYQILIGKKQSQILLTL